MTENLSKMPVKGILRKSSLTFIEHDDSDLPLKLDAEKPTKVIVEPAHTPPKEYPGETADEKARREEFELKRKLLQHQEAVTVHMAKKLLSDENIEEEVETNPEEDLETSDVLLSDVEPNKLDTNGSTEEHKMHE